MANPTTTVAVDGPVSLVVRLGRGTVTVRARPDLAEATVTLAARDGRADAIDEITVTRHGDTLEVASPRAAGFGGLGELVSGFRRQRRAVDAVIEVPGGSSVSVASAGEAITLDGRVGDTELTAGSGTIAVDRVDGDLRLRWGRGDCRVGTVSGSVEVRAGAGDVRIAEAGGRIDGSTGTGEVVVDTARGGVRWRSGSGAARLGSVHADVDVALGAGPVSIGLPAGIRSKVDAATGRGSVTSDLPVEPSRAPGGPSITVRAHTGSGNVRLVRAA